MSKFHKPYLGLGFPSGQNQKTQRLQLHKVYVEVNFSSSLIIPTVCTECSPHVSLLGASWVHVDSHRSHHCTDRAAKSRRDRHPPRERSWSRRNIRDSRLSTLVLDFLLPSWLGCLINTLAIRVSTLSRLKKTLIN